MNAGGDYPTRTVINYLFRKENRRWFSDDYFDLIVWFKREGAITGIQLSYDKQGRERAVIWRIGEGFSHESVDSGEANPAKNRSPVLVPDGECPVEEILERFRVENEFLDPVLHEFVMDKLKILRVN